jgi:hypothetical protein
MRNEVDTWLCYEKWENGTESYGRQLRNMGQRVMKDLWDVRCMYTQHGLCARHQWKEKMQLEKIQTEKKKADRMNKIIGL